MFEFLKLLEALAPIVIEAAIVMSVLSNVIINITDETDEGSH
jgi:hypothetical protein